MTALTLAPDATAEFHIVPLKKGSYDYHETRIFSPFWGEVISTADVGLIYVH